MHQNQVENTVENYERRVFETVTEWIDTQLEEDVRDKSPEEKLNKIIVKKKKIIYAPDATMQAMLSDKKGRVLIIEPGIGYRYEQENFSLITNYSILKPDITKPYIVSGDTRYEVAKELLAGYDKDFSVNDAFKVLKSVSQKDLWATRVSFVYSTEKNKVYYVLNNDFSNVFEFQF